MSLNKKLVSHLAKNKIEHQVLDHKKVYTAIDAANTLKVKLEGVAKTLILKADKDYYLVLLSANRQANFAKLMKALKSKKVTLPKETELIKVLKIKPGQVTGFGSIHKLPTIIDKSFTSMERAVISGGSLVQSVSMKVKDFMNLEKPLVIPFSDKKKIKIQLSNKKKKIVKKISKKKK